jgi:hypothetical protein
LVMAWVRWVRTVAGLRIPFGGDVVVVQALPDEGQDLAFAVGEDGEAF